MLYQIISYVLETVTAVVAGACLLRAFMQYCRAPFSNPIGEMVFALSNWLVLPLRKTMGQIKGPGKGSGSLDWPSVVAAYLIELAHAVLLWVLAGANHQLAPLGDVPVFALFALGRLALSGLTGLVMFYVILSWLNPASQAFGLLSRLVEPLLEPVRRVVPLFGQVDLSPFVVFVLLNIASMVWAGLQNAVVQALSL
jgi:YggT family protein